jgi:transcriptional regulator with GAF, ATPase, and Fis domain
MTLSALEAEHILSVLASTDWRIRGVGGAAERLGLKPTTLESRMARLGITRKRAS